MEEFREQLIEQNRKDMQRINKKFTAAFYICAVPAALKILSGLIDLLVSIMTVAIAKWSLGSIASTIMGVILVLSAAQAHQKNQRSIIVTMAMLILSFIVTVIFHGEYGLELIYMFAGCVAQMLCMSQFKELERLSTQEGYPDFNAVYYHRDPLSLQTVERPSRLASGNDNNKKNEKTSVGTDMYEIESLPETDGDYSNYYDEQKRRKEL